MRKWSAAVLILLLSYTCLVSCGPGGDGTDPENVGPQAQAPPAQPFRSRELPPLPPPHICCQRSYMPPELWERGERLAVFPELTSWASVPEYDLRVHDLSALDLADKGAELRNASFDSTTAWPANLPEGFDPLHIMELGKDPGLGVRELHAEGITGRGVGLAIIDQALPANHVEYRDQLRHYEEINCPGEYASMHGPAVASIAVGRTVGVAPEADLYYIATTTGEFVNGRFIRDLSSMAESIDRVLEINDGLPEGRKIRIISISLGLIKGEKGSVEYRKAVRRAIDEGILVITTSLRETHSFQHLGLGRRPTADPNDVSSYRIGAFLELRTKHRSAAWGRTIWVPMDSRCTAAFSGPEDYVFFRNGGMSWAVPYLAGVYALACQVQPEITQEEFLRLAIDTGDPFRVGSLTLESIINPRRLIAQLQLER